MNLKEITKDLQKHIDELQSQGIDPSMGELNNFINDITMSANANSEPDFCGFSPNQMHDILYTPFEADCCVQINDLTDSELMKLPLFRQTKHLMSLLKENEINLTKAGYIPPKIVKELYALGASENYIEKGICKLNNESDTETIQFLRIVLKDGGLIKVRQSKMSLTKLGSKTLTDLNLLNQTITKFALTKYNVAYFDEFNNEQIGNIAQVYSLWMMHYYGKNWREEKFYDKLYYKAFPMFFNFTRIYSCRIIRRLFNFLGLVEINYCETDFKKNKVRKTPLLDLLFKFEDPK
jgi:hypothetical protein